MKLGLWKIDEKKTGKEWQKIPKTGKKWNIETRTKLAKIDRTSKKNRKNREKKLQKLKEKFRKKNNENSRIFLNKKTKIARWKIEHKNGRIAKNDKNGQKVKTRGKTMVKIEK